MGGLERWYSGLLQNVVAYERKSVETQLRWIEPGRA